MFLCCRCFLLSSSFFSSAEIICQVSVCNSAFVFFDFLIYFTCSLITEIECLLHKCSWKHVGFHARFQKILHLDCQLKVPQKQIIHVELFCHDDILTQMLYAIPILLSCHLNYLALKLFLLYIWSRLLVFVTFLEITMTKSECLQLKLDFWDLLFDVSLVSKCFCHLFYAQRKLMLLIAQRKLMSHLCDIWGVNLSKTQDLPTCFIQRFLQGRRIYRFISTCKYILYIIYYSLAKAT